MLHKQLCLFIYNPRLLEFSSAVLAALSL